jgi:hypothetical protein
MNVAEALVPVQSVLSAPLVFSHGQAGRLLFSIALIDAGGLDKIL